MTDFYNLLRRLLTPDNEDKQGVLRGVGSELVVSGTSSPLSLAAGAALVYGLFYENTAAKNLTVATPVVGTTGGRINLKADWTAQTVRAQVQLNTDGVADIPALTQTAGVEWSLPLYTFTITTAGGISLTRVVEYCQFADYITADMIQDVTGLSVIGRASNSEGDAELLTAANDGEVLVRSGNTLGFGQVGTDGIADDAVDTDQIADDAVDDTKVGERVFKLNRRQGGSSTDWNSAGASNYTPGNVRMQSGIVTVSIANGQSYGVTTVTFPEAFSYKPLVFFGVNSNTSALVCVRADAQSASALDIIVNRSSTSGDLSVTVGWLAIGEE